MSYEETVFSKYDFLGGPFANIKGQQIRKLIMPACSLYLRNIDIGISGNVHPGGWLEIGLVLIWGPEFQFGCQEITQVSLRITGSNPCKCSEIV